MPILATLHAGVGAWIDLAVSAEKTRDALQVLIDHPHPITEYRFEDELRQRLAQAEADVALFRERLTQAQRQFATAERALSAPAVPASAEAV